MAEAPEASPHYASACVRVGDYEVTYLAAGEGPETVLLLHGFGAWSEVAWAKTLPALAPRYRVVAPDLLGFGLSSKPGLHVFRDGVDPFDVESRFLADFLDALGIREAAVVGSSFGGGLALRLATRFPERVTKLALVGSMGLGRSIHPVYKALATPYLGNALARPDKSRLRRMWRWVVHDPALVTDAVIDRNFDLLSQPGAAEIVLATRHGVGLIGQKVVFYEDLPRIRHPTLVVWGREDRVFPLRHAMRAARLIPGARLVVLDDCGHVPPFEKPDAFNAALLDFLARPAAAGEAAPVARDAPVPSGGEPAPV